jgi:5-methylcytosine-specific restriction endonuclease McrA
MTGTSFQHAKRLSMTPQRRAAIFQARGGRCYLCSRNLTPRDDWDIEHVIALENGGTDDDTNLEVCCDWCHRPKTAEDHATAGHGRRMATKHVVPKRFRQSRWGRR